MCFGQPVNFSVKWTTFILDFLCMSLRDSISALFRRHSNLKNMKKGGQALRGLREKSALKMKGKIRFGKHFDDVRAQ